MKRRCSCAVALAMAVFYFLILTGTQARADKRAELDAALKTIDMKLYEQNQADICAWLDARIAASGEFAVYPFTGTYVKISGNKAVVDLNRGMLADTAAQFLPAYEMLGDRKYLEAGLKTVEFLPGGSTAGGELSLRGDDRTRG